MWLRLAEYPTQPNGTRLVDCELFNTRLALKTPGGPVGEGDAVVIFTLFGVQFLPDQIALSIPTALNVPVVAGMLKGQHAGLVQRYVGDRLTRRVELDFPVVFFACVFGHDEVLYCGGG